MGRSSQKPRVKLDPKKFEAATDTQQKKEKDWGFEEIARSKTRRR